MDTAEREKYTSPPFHDVAIVLPPDHDLSMRLRPASLPSCPIFEGSTAQYSLIRTRLRGTLVNIRTKEMIRCTLQIGPCLSCVVSGNCDSGPRCADAAEDIYWSWVAMDRWRPPWATARGSRARGRSWKERDAKCDESHTIMSA